MLTQTAPPTAQALAPVTSDTIWYFVQIIADDLYGFYLELEETYLGLGHKEQVWAAAEARYPGCTVMDWMICHPQP